MLRASFTDVSVRHEDKQRLHPFTGTHPVTGESVPCSARARRAEKYGLLEGAVGGVLLRVADARATTAPAHVPVGAEDGNVLSDLRLAFQASHAYRGARASPDTLGPTSLTVRLQLWPVRAWFPVGTPRLLAEALRNRAGPGGASSGVGLRWSLFALASRVAAAVPAVAQRSILSALLRSFGYTRLRVHLACDSAEVALAMAGAEQQAALAAAAAAASASAASVEDQALLCSVSSLSATATLSLGDAPPAVRALGGVAAAMAAAEDGQWRLQGRVGTAAAFWYSEETALLASRLGDGPLAMQDRALLFSAQSVTGEWVTGTASGRGPAPARVLLVAERDCAVRPVLLARLAARLVAGPSRVAALAGRLWPSPGLSWRVEGRGALHFLGAPPWTGLRLLDASLAAAGQPDDCEFDLRARSVSVADDRSQYFADVLSLGVEQPERDDTSAGGRSAADGLFLRARVPRTMDAAARPVISLLLNCARLRWLAQCAGEWFDAVTDFYASLRNVDATLVGSISQLVWR